MPKSAKENSPKLRESFTKNLAPNAVNKKRNVILISNVKGSCLENVSMMFYMYVYATF
jgi:hypothetical protein